MRTLVTAFAFAGLAACSSAKSTTPAGTDAIPTLAVDTPLRGTSVDGSTVTVTGFAFDDGAVQVTVNGAPATVNEDGSFSATVDVADGIDLIDTHAIDSTGNDVRDVRAVLAGKLAPTDGTVSAPIGVHASAASLRTIGNTMADTASAIDYTAVAAAANPVYDNGGCLGATVNVTSVELSDVDVALVPGAGALDTDVTLKNVVVKLHANYKVACIGGSGTITVSASAAHIRGDLGVTVAHGELVTSLPSANVVLDDFDLQVSGIPSQITGLVEGTVRNKIESALGSAIQTKVPPIANTKLAGLLAKPFSTGVLGHTTQITVTPTAATLSASGLYLGVDTKVLVTKGGGGKALTAATSSPDALMDDMPDLGVAVANDVINQLLAGLWAAHAFDQTIPLSSVAAVGAFLDPNATQLALSLSLPPTAATDANGVLQLSIGDAILSVQDDHGTELQRIALSVKTGLSLSATASGGVAMTLATPTVAAQVLGQVDDGSLPLTGEQVEGLVTGAWGLLAGQATTALGKLPMPAIAGMQLGAPTVSAVDNYVLAEMTIE